MYSDYFDVPTTQNLIEWYLLIAEEIVSFH